MRKRFATSALAGLILAIVISLSSNPIRVSAHAFLLRTEPADGLVLADAPKQMRFWFSEPLEIALTTITLQDGNDKTRRLKLHADPYDPSVIVADLPELPPNAYRVNWRTVSDEDLHIISGSVVFGIQQSVSREGSRQTQNTTPFAEAGLRWIGLLAFAAGMGCLINISFLFPSVRAKIQGEHNEIILSSMQGKIISLALWCSIAAFLAG